MIFMQKKPLKIAVTGPESTGKSALTRALALHYNGDINEEYAREYIAHLNRAYSYDDILVIARKQIENEVMVCSGSSKEFVFCDTELLVTKIWCLHKFEKCHGWIEDMIERNTYDLFLLCNIDLPWEFDVQREHPHLRDYFFRWYKHELEQYQFPYFVVSGNGGKRLENAIEIIDNYIKINKAV